MTNLTEMLPKRLRDARGAMTGREFARRCGIKAQSLSRYERIGGALPGAELLARMASAADVSADWLLGLTDVRTPHSAPLPTDAASGDAEALREEVSRLREAVAARDAAISHLSTAVARLAAPLAACAGGASSESSRTEGA